MKQLFCAFLCLLPLALCEPVWADTDYYIDTGCVPNKKDGKRTDCNTIRAYVAPDPCLATMEQAMRQIEPYLIEYDKKTQTARALLRNFEGLKRAHAQWDAAKACWKAQP